MKWLQIWDMSKELVFGGFDLLSSILNQQFFFEFVWAAGLHWSLRTTNPEKRRMLQVAFLTGSELQMETPRQS